MIPWARVQNPIERNKWAEHKHSSPSVPWLWMHYAASRFLCPVSWVRINPSFMKLLSLGISLEPQEITDRSTKSKERLKSQELSIRTNEYSIKSKSSYDRGWQGGSQVSPLWSYDASVVVCAWKEGSLSLQPNIKPSADLKHYEIFFCNLITSPALNRLGKW